MIDNSVAQLKAENLHTSCLPIMTLAELYTYMDSPPTWSNYVVPLVPRGNKVPNIPLNEDGHFCHGQIDDWMRCVGYRMPGGSEDTRTHKAELLLCHDMKNGYLDDRFIEGTDCADAYRLYCWSIVDVFVYFSHHFITIPPLGWINSAHRNGVQVMGTVITEWNEGLKICEEILATEESMKKCVQYLVHICKYFQLQGWLLNIENSITDTRKMRNFVSHLTSKLHSEVPGARIIWYDSVTSSGELAWQNELNDHNKIFYSACDGIFLNYTWTKEHLARSLSNCGIENSHKVFVGVDVFGRNQYGGGGFQTQVAVDMINTFGFSTAMFAPGWTHETMCTAGNASLESKENKSVTDTAKSILKTCLPPTILNNPTIQSNARALRHTVAATLTTSQNTHSSSSQESNQSHSGGEVDNLKLFLQREDLFWSLLWRYFPSAEHVHLPLSTSFCQGSGLKKWQDGQITLKKAWFNLNNQEVQPSVLPCNLRYKLSFQHSKDELQEVPPSVNCLEYNFDDSYSGGSCLKLSRIDTTESHITRLFVCNFEIKSFLIFCVISKSLNGDLDLVLVVQDKNGVSSNISLVNYPTDVKESSTSSDANSEVAHDHINYADYINSFIKEDVKTTTDNILEDCDKKLNPNSLTYVEKLNSDVILREAQDPELKHIQRFILNNYPNLYVHPGQSNGWNISYFVLPYNGYTIREIGGLINGPVECSALLGGLSVIPYDQ